MRLIKGICFCCTVVLCLGTMFLLFALGYLVVWVYVLFVLLGMSACVCVTLIFGCGVDQVCDLSGSLLFAILIGFCLFVYKCDFGGI